MRKSVYHMKKTLELVLWIFLRGKFKLAKLMTESGEDNNTYPYDNPKQYLFIYVNLKDLVDLFCFRIINILRYQKAPFIHW